MTCQIFIHLDKTFDCEQIKQCTDWLNVLLQVEDPQHLLGAFIIQKVGLIKHGLWSQDGLDGDKALVLIKHLPYGLQRHIVCGTSTHVKRHTESLTTLRCLNATYQDLLTII